jgi:hypothetical protein
MEIFSAYLSKMHRLYRREIHLKPPCKLSDVDITLSSI